MSMRIDGRPVDSASRPFVIAEISGNHRGSLERARELVEAAAEAGADAVKFQTYTADTITIDHDGDAFRIGADHPLWGSRTLYDLYEEAHTPWDWHPELFALARSRGVVPFSSPFDVTALDLLVSLDAPAIKIASLEVGDTALLRAAAATGRPVIISDGASTFAELAEAVEVLRAAGGEQIAVLACTSSYPAEPRDANVRRIPVLRDALGVQVGISDHTLGVGVAVAAVALGASIIEKHLTLERGDGGVDSDFSLVPDELALLVTESRRAFESLGSPTARLTASEAESRRLRRSLWVVQDVREGDVVSPTTVRSIRPAGGLAPVQLETVLGRRFRRDVDRGTPLTWDQLLD